MHSSTATSEICISDRFCGPPNSGNGGYTCGLVARHFAQHLAPNTPCEVMLRAPPPLNTALSFHCDADNRKAEQAELRYGDTVIATAQRKHYDINVPPAPSLAQAAKAEKNCRGLRNHTFPCCFVCGPDRAPGDGLRIFAGQENGNDTKNKTGLVASRWTPDASLGYTTGELDAEFIWAALDCPGYFAVREQAQYALLGSLCATILQPIQVDEALVVIGWPIHSDGRKHRAGTAIYRGEMLLASAVATWVSISKDYFEQANRPG